MSMPLTERTNEIHILEEMLSACRSGVGQLALITGPVGCGKTEVLDAFAERALRDGALVLSATAKRSGAEFPYDVLVQLFGVSGVPERLRTRMDQLVDVASSADPEAAAVRTQALRVLHAELLALTADRPVVIVVDDVQRADQESLRELPDLASRLRRAPALLVFSQSDEENAATALVQAELLRHRHWRRIDLALLSVEGVEALVRAEGDRVRLPLSAVEIRRLSGGNPLLVRALLDDLGAVDPRLTGTAFGQAVLACLHRSSPETLAVARGIAVLGRPTGVPLLADLVEIDQQQTQIALRSLESAGLVSAGDFRNPASRTAVLAEFCPERRGSMHRRAAELLYLQGASASTVARHLVEAGGTGQRWAQRLLREAAEIATASDDLDFASECLDLAFKSSPDDDERVSALARLAGVVWRRNPVAAVRHVSLLIEPSRRGLLSDRQVTAVARSLVWHGMTGEALEVIEAAGRTGKAGDERHDAELGMIRRWLRAWHPPLAKMVGETPLRSQAAGRTSVGDERLLGAALLSEVLTRGGSRDVSRRAAEILRGCGGQVDESTLDPAESALLALLYSDDAEQALTWCDPLLAAAAERHAPTWNARLEAVRAEIALHRGDLPNAERYAHAALDRIEARGWGVAAGAPLATIIQATTMMGDLDTAGVYVKTSVPQEMFRTRFGLRYLYARGLYLSACERFHWALRDLLTCGKLAVEWEMDLPSFAPWRGAAAMVYLKLGDRDRAQKLASAQLIRAKRGLPRASGISLRAVAACTDMRGRLRMLREAVDLLRSVGDRFELACTLADLHQAYQATGERQRANAVFQRALRLAMECRAEPLRRSLLRRSSEEHAESLALEQSNGGLVQLSRAEQRVTALAAAGHTNREIAAMLHITVSTVEQHLTKAYRKLNVRTRADLAAACMPPLVDSA
ncbi:helix-turn-helix transcriptional regulator [Micromonospora eburnea]|uniref:Regulatory protein, luxR family n=1 Tax=Micromonospora eburnea TaxID=227316 RepID=A0A1C6V0F6_9ACTN|nr:LuxR family transcriptional regulator [Micromonospora eburnea]SCL59779.1 regulatory protein, luxR family [Micromonospora eburnea]